RGDLTQALWKLVRQLCREGVGRRNQPEVLGELEVLRELGRGRDLIGDREVVRHADLSQRLDHVVGRLRTTRRRGLRSVASQANEKRALELVAFPVDTLLD